MCEDVMCGGVCVQQADLNLLYWSSEGGRGVGGVGGVGV